MLTPSRLLLFLLLGLLLAGAAVLASWDMRPPASTVEIVLPDDRFPQ